MKVGILLKHKTIDKEEIIIPNNGWKAYNGKIVHKRQD
jgi:hypothetical protein